jgi:Tfp pilus assembly protein PilO
MNVPPKNKRKLQQSTLVVIGCIAGLLAMLFVSAVTTQAKLSSAQSERDALVKSIQDTKQEVFTQQNLFKESQDAFRNTKLFVDRIEAYAAYNTSLNKTVGSNTRGLLSALSNKQAMTIRNFDPVYNQFRQIGSTVFEGANYTFEISGNYRAIGSFIEDLENAVPLHIFENLDIQPTTDSAEQLKANIRMFVVDGIKPR